MKIALAQLNYHIGNIESNTQKILTAIQQAKQEGAHLVVFAELAICGYPPLDFLESSKFIDACEQAIEQIVNACSDIACIVGAPAKNTHIAGKDLYNAAYFIEKGAIKTIVHKALLPNYDVFDEYRYFEPARQLQCIHFMGHTIALTICEDLWNLNKNPLYTTSPMEILIQEEPDMMINIAASPFTYNHLQERITVLRGNCRNYRLPLFYVNQVGAQTELIFDGCSLVFDADGQIVDQLPGFIEAMHCYEFKDVMLPSVIRHTASNQLLDDSSSLHDALILGIQDYFKKSGFSKAILGLSGGIDSALVCALACKALGPENVLAILMPSVFTSDHAINDATALVQKLGCKQEIVPINKAVSAFESMLKPLFKDSPPNVAEENIQSRCRMITLMAMANKYGYIVLNASNKSELAVGYGTLYGDMAGAIGVIGDLYKTQIYKLCNYINRQEEIIPKNILTKAPSAELRPDQKDTDSLPEYNLLDKLLFEYIELNKDPNTIIALGFDDTLVHRIVKMVNNAEFKRYQSLPILRVSTKAFGLGRRMPIVGNYLE